MSLLDLAQKENLPDGQFMDKPTLLWIQKNKPHFKTNYFDPEKANYAWNQAKIFLPKTEWFLKKGGINSIHGLRHLIRVVANTGYLIKMKKVSKKAALNCLVAASLHDLQRGNDKGDPDHGKRSAEWVFNNCKEIGEKYHLNLNNESLKEICLMIRLHEVPYGQIFNKVELNNLYLRYQDNVDVLKTADALDRYRLPKLSWWMNEKYLKLSLDEEIKVFAYNLVVKSEEKYLSGTADSAKSVLFVLESLSSKKNYGRRE